MKTIRTQMNWPTMFLLVVVVALLAHGTRANRASQAPTVVATVNLEEIFRSIDQRERVDADLTRLAQDLDKQGTERREEIELLRTDLELYPVGSTKYQEVSKELARRTYQLQAFLDFAMRKLDLEKSITLRELYASIKTSVGAISEMRGYDVVFVDDSIAPLPTEIGEAETMRQISARRMLFARPPLDITQELIQAMNENAP